MPPDPKPYPKDAQLARGERRYKRKVANAQGWQKIADAKRGPCRVCLDPATNGRLHGLIQFHHIVARAHGGDDVADNIAPLCLSCHGAVTMREPFACRRLVETLTDAEYSYAVDKCGESFWERAYGLTYSR